MGGNIFVCRRRSDAAGVAGRLRDRLAERFPEDEIFFDTDRLQPGQYSAGQIRRAVSTADVILVLIGAGWYASRVENGQGGGDGPDDHVCLEIAIALAQGKIIIPVLLDAATMPVTQSLPEDIRPFARMSAATLSQAHFDADAARLFVVLENALEEARQAARRRGGQQSVEAGNARIHVPEAEPSGTLTEPGEAAERSHRDAPLQTGRPGYEDLLAEYDALIEKQILEKESYFIRYRNLVLSPFERYSGTRFFAGFLLLYFTILVFLYFSMVGGRN